MTNEAVIYTRLSLDRNGDFLGVERQQKACREVAARHGWTVTHVYSDNSISAYKSNVFRPEYEQMRQDYEVGMFTRMIIWDLDRLTRQPAQMEEWLSAAEMHGLRVVTVDDNLDLSTYGGQLHVRIKAAVSKAAIDQMRARMRLAGKQRAEKGKAWSAVRPFGFAEDLVSHHPVEAELALGMYRMYLDGESQHEIMRTLNRAGVPTTRGNQWSQAAVRQFLRNPRNAGLRAYDGEIVGPAEWEGLVPRDMWETVVARMNLNARRLKEKGVVSTGRTPKHLLTGIARCWKCDATVRTAQSRGGQRQYGCPAAHVNRVAEPVDELVTKLVLALIQKFGLSAAPDSGDGDADKLALIREQEVLQERRDQLANDYADGVLTRDQVRTANQRITARLEEIGQELSAPESGRLLRPLAEAADLTKAWDDLPLTRKREIVKLLVQVVILPTTRGSREFNPEHVDITPQRELQT